LTPAISFLLPLHDLYSLPTPTGLLKSSLYNGTTARTELPTLPYYNLQCYSRHLVLSPDSLSHNLRHCGSYPYSLALHLHLNLSKLLHLRSHSRTRPFSRLSLSGIEHSHDSTSTTSARRVVDSLVIQQLLPFSFRYHSDSSPFPTLFHLNLPRPLHSRWCSTTLPFPFGPEPFHDNTPTICDRPLVDFLSIRHLPLLIPLSLQSHPRSLQTMRPCSRRFLRIHGFYSTLLTCDLPILVYAPPFFPCFHPPPPLICVYILVQGRVVRQIRISQTSDVLSIHKDLLCQPLLVPSMAYGSQR
jgi:hypothetical protein